jgi:hypothetical protein
LLGSERQKVDLSADGFFDIHPKAKELDVQVQILIQDLLLQLPPLDPIHGFPKIAKDSRFEISPPQKKKRTAGEFKVSYHIQVKTKNPNSIRLLSSLAEPLIPLGVDLTIQSESPLQGSIQLQPFDIEYLKRRSTVEKLNITVNDPKGIFPVNGRFRVDQNPYKIYVDVLGTLKSPIIHLSSEPYLDRSDIISVLLYGRTNDQLVAVDSKTVGSFDAAIADRAMGLFSIWAFSSTPIQSFSYNQLTQQYTAQVKLSDDTTFSVGTNWEEAATLELQKRLSEQWIISASLEPTTNNNQDEQVEKLRLQWEDRF